MTMPVPRWFPVQYARAGARDLLETKVETSGVVTSPVTTDSHARDDAAPLPGRGSWTGEGDNPHPPCPPDDAVGLQAGSTRRGDFSPLAVKWRRPGRIVRARARDGAGVAVTELSAQYAQARA